MLTGLYPHLLLVCSVALLLFSLALVMGRLPEGDEYSGYAHGKIFYGIAGFTMGLGFFLIWIIDRDRANSAEDAAIYLTACYIAQLPYWMANLAMLDSPYANTKKSLRLSYMLTPLFLILMWTGVYVPSKPLSIALLILAEVLLIARSVYYCSLIFKTFRHNVQIMEGYSYGEHHRHLRWVAWNSMIMEIAIVTMVPLAFQGPGVLAIALLCLTALAFYLFISISNYFINFESLHKAISSTREGQQTARVIDADSNATYRLLSKKIENWCAEGGPYKKDISLDSVAAELGTNRTYLSNYINDVQGMNFRDWISDLKIEKAKELLAVTPEISISDIVEQIGSSSQSFFARKFKEVVGQTPTEYRKNLKI